MTMIELHIAGRSTTKQRPRFDPRTKRAYTPPSNTIGENDVRAIWREAGEPRIDDDVAIAIRMVVRVCRPGGHFRKDGGLSMEGIRHPIPRNKKPDLDNAIKLVMDALNSRAYKDDVQVARILVEREWGHWPETIVYIEALGTSI
jgi:Holliday junction resolvase RusA-like endonuclease